MSNSIHGHDVMEMMLEASAPFTRASLEAAIHERFGKDARFHTCSAKDMTASELIDFLQARGKFVTQDGGFNTAPDKICHH